MSGQSSFRMNRPRSNYIGIVYSGREIAVFSGILLDIPKSNTGWPCALITFDVLVVVLSSLDTTLFTV